MTTDPLTKLANEMRVTYRAAMATAAHSIRNPNDPTARAAARTAAMAHDNICYAYYLASLEATR